MSAVATLDTLAQRGRRASETDRTEIMAKTPWHEPESGRTLPGLQPEKASAEPRDIAGSTRPFDRHILGGHATVFEPAVPSVIVAESARAAAARPSEARAAPDGLPAPASDPLPSSGFSSLAPFAVDTALPKSSASPDATSVLPVIHHGVADRLIGARRRRLAKTLSRIGAAAAFAILLAGGAIGASRLTAARGLRTNPSPRSLGPVTTRPLALTTIESAVAKKRPEPPAAPRPKRRPAR